MLWGRVGDIGYLNLLSMEGFGATRGDTSVLDAALDEAIAAFEGARAVIVDVSYNLGGYDRVAQHIAGRFADGRRLAYTKVGLRRARRRAAAVPCRAVEAARAISARSTCSPAT